jgi:hypothetical protein
MQLATRKLHLKASITALTCARRLAMAMHGFTLLACAAILALVQVTAQTTSVADMLNPITDRPLTLCRPPS